MSFLYVIAPANNQAGPCKIGISHNPTNRLKQLQTGFPEVLKVYYQEETTQEKVTILERILHRDMNHKRKTGEWFNLSVDEAIAHVKFTIIRYGDILDLEQQFKKRKI